MKLTFNVSLPQFQVLWENQHGDCFLVCTTCQKYNRMLKAVQQQIFETENVQWCIIKLIANLYISGMCPCSDLLIQLIYFLKMSDMLCERCKMLCKIYIPSS